MMFKIDCLVYEISKLRATDYTFCFDTLPIFKNDN